MKRHNVADSIAWRLDAMANCKKAGNTEWLSRHREEIDRIIADCLPSGSGIDNGVALDFQASTSRRIVFDVSFHHMNDGGFYNGWSDHRVSVVPVFVSGLQVTVSGRNRNDIKDYLGEMFDHALSADSPVEYQPTPFHPADCDCRHCKTRREQKAS